MSPQEARRRGRSNRRRLARFFVDRVLVVPTAELLHLDAFAVVDTRFHRDVVPTLAIFAGQGDLEPFISGFSHGALPVYWFARLGCSATPPLTGTLHSRRIY
jgi:hypothetical protein